MSDLKRSIINTISFFDIFSYPLTAEEIKKYLYKYKNPIHIKEIKGTIEEMEEIEKIHGYYVLKDRANLADTRKARKFLAEKLWGRTRQYCQYLTNVPFVEMIAACNSLAYDNPNEESDIDLFIVIKKDRMWFARTAITAILHFFGVRRHKNKIAGRFCLSFFTTPEKMDMSELELKPEDPYLAYWTKLLMPVYGEKAYADFVEKNKKWLKEKYALSFSAETPEKITFRNEKKIKKILEKALDGKLGDLTESAIKKLLKKRALKKAENLKDPSGTIISDDILKFHDEDMREKYREKMLNVKYCMSS